MNSVSHITMPCTISTEVQELSTRILDSVNDPDSRVGEETAVSIPPTWPQIDEIAKVDGKTSHFCNGTEVNP